MHQLYAYNLMKLCANGTGAQRHLVGDLCHLITLTDTFCLICKGLVDSEAA